jgi:hypothetical protein
MIATDVYACDAYASYWHTIEADSIDPAPVAVYDLDCELETLVGTAPGAYEEFSTLSED